MRKDTRKHILEIEKKIRRHELMKNAYTLFNVVEKSKASEQIILDLENKLILTKLESAI